MLLAEDSPFGRFLAARDSNFLEIVDEGRSDIFDGLEFGTGWRLIGRQIACAWASILIGTTHSRSSPKVF
jgi:hypothetical protein